MSRVKCCLIRKIPQHSFATQNVNSNDLQFYLAQTKETHIYHLCTNIYKIHQKYQKLHHTICAFVKQGMINNVYSKYDSF